MKGDTVAMIRNVGTMGELIVRATTGGVILTRDLAMKLIVGEEGMKLTEAIAMWMIVEGQTMIIVEDTVVMTEALAVVQLYRPVMTYTKKCEEGNEQTLHLEGIKP
mmetsp:Transcript_277/g.707  ORF Transcript_277/g.707 Transcript_277/m.707 type:complete len:106 (+) Transcript_277:1096-1413(+)